MQKIYRDHFSSDLGGSKHGEYNTKSSLKSRAKRILTLGYTTSALLHAQTDQTQIAYQIVGLYFDQKSDNVFNKHVIGDERAMRQKARQ